MQTVYGDILFFVNFCMDLQCLFLTARLLHRPFFLWRGVLASVLGALYACAALFLSVSGGFAFAADCGVCLLMCVLTFYTKGMRPRGVLIPFALYFGVSAAVGGVMSATAALLSHMKMPLAHGESELSSLTFFLLAGLGGVATLAWGRLCRRRAKGKRAALTLTVFGKTDTLRCMVDTANLLRDPTGGLPVALIDSRAAAALLPPPLLKVSGEGGYSALTELPTDQVRRVRLIPTQTATGQGMLLAVAPDAALLDAGRGNLPVELLIAPVPLSVDRDDYAVLLPAELIT